MTQFNTTSLNLRHLHTDEMEQLSKQQFNSLYGYPNVPVLFSRAFQEWKIKERWTLDYLQHHLVENEMIQGCDTLETRSCTLKEYLREYLPGGYYFKTQKHLSAPQLLDDFSSPETFNCWYADNSLANTRLRLSWLYVGKANTFSNTHRDLWGTSAWNYLISGKKLWLIFPEAYTAYIKEHMTIFSLRNKSLGSYNFSELPYRPLYCEQRPGELVFIPNGCYHAVINLELSVSITENFINETNYDGVRTFFRKSPNKKNIQDIERIIKEGFEKKVHFANK